MQDFVTTLDNQSYETDAKTPSTDTASDTPNYIKHTKNVATNADTSNDIVSIADSEERLCSGPFVPPAVSSPSLMNPDFSGLYSVASLGTKNRKWYNVFLGGFAVFIFIYSWLLGFFVPNFALIFLFFEYYYSGIIIILVLLVSYILPVKESSLVCRLYVKYAAFYFKGGASMCMENDPCDESLSVVNYNYENEQSSQLQSTDNANKRPIIAACHPHGIFCLGYFFCGGVRVAACANSSNEEKLEICGKWALSDNIFQRFPRRGLVVGYLSKFPIFNTFITKLTGCVGSVEPKNMKKTMLNKESFGICPGGFDEATMFAQNENAIYISERKGFIKYCLKYGSYEVKPCYIFGECSTYKNWANIMSDKFKQLLNKYKIPTVCPTGPMWYFPFLIYLPYNNIGLHCIVGKSIIIPKIDNPTQSDIDKYHTLYVNELKRIFDTNKWRFGLNDAKLIVR